MFNVGDEVVSLVCPNMVGTVIKIFGGTGNLLVRVPPGSTILADPEHWRLLKKGEKDARTQES